MTMIANVEVTDTFGGEANFSWVRRTQFPAPESNLALIRRAKAFAGWIGVRCQVTDTGDCVEVRPHKAASVMFITFSEE